MGFLTHVARDVDSRCKVFLFRIEFVVSVFMLTKLNLLIHIFTLLLILDLLDCINMQTNIMPCMSGNITQFYL